MKIKHISLTLLCAIAAFKVQAQDLSSKIPSNPEFVLTVNNKAILQNGTTELVNEFLEKTGIYKELSNTQEVHSLDQLALDLQRNAYMYNTVTDSVSYMVALLPLKNSSYLPEEIFPKVGNLPQVDGFNVNYIEHLQAVVAYNNNTLMVVYPSLKDPYFEREDVIEHYGLVPEATQNYWDYDYSYDEDEQDQSQQWEAYDFEQAQEHAPGCEHYKEPEVEYAVAESESTDYQGDYAAKSKEITEAYHPSEEPKTGVALHEYEQADEYYGVDYEGAYDAYQTTDGVLLPGLYEKSQNEIILDSLSKEWLVQALPGIISPKNVLSQNKKIILKDNSTLVRFWANDFNAFYSNLLGTSDALDPFGLNLNAFKSGYSQLQADLVVQGNVLKLTAEAAMDKDFATYTKKVLKHKINPKIKQYIPSEHLGFMSLNVNMQEYIQRTPGMFYQQYGKFISGSDDIVLAVTTALEVTLDSKGISNMLPGDMVVFINDVQEVTKHYTSYEWDDDYNLVEEEKTKQVSQAQFLAIGTSKDQRLFKALLQIGINKNDFTYDSNTGIYTLPDTSDLMQVYMYFKGDLMFVGSDYKQIQSISNGTFKADPLNTTRKELSKGHPLNIVFHTDKLSEVLENLDFPFQGPLEKAVPDLKNYGDIQIYSSIKGSNKVYSEISVSFPNQKNATALSYLLTQITNLYK
ncbi:hypothetical protein ACYSNX_04300 [Myroides sp. LJL115]